MKKQHKYCLYCGGETVKKFEDNVRRDFCPACHSYFYINPLPVVSSILESSREVLLVKRDRAPSKGLWCLPTGFAETGESIEEAALRELEEETGIRGKIIKLLDVDSYKSRFYGDLLFLTFVVQQTGGKLCAGDDCSQARFWPVNKLPPLAFRSNKLALETYIKSRKDYWAIFDSIEHADKKTLPAAVAKNSLTRRLVNVIIKNKEKIIEQWLDDVVTNPSTSEYHHVERSVLYNICDRILSQITLWLGDVHDVNKIRNFYTKLGRERKKSGFKLSEALSALSLIRKHIWTFALAQDVLQKNLDLFMTFELQRRMTVFFDLATFYLTRGHEGV
ncbi:MAG TPA: NUDIX domain-containing protein [Smithella sp.]|mgnify:CR=1 FL=1|nr:NUDIX hydrolase [Smithella sp.]MDM7986118.1 NUDIX domain-containing protein [Smithella sp.]HNY48985.1 NUDIX domain-containing protein [Smithella sp.]HOG89069.1 NUDIX domain-containing protein [Smithella sp.]HOU50981.1 NUDIX domain-containing protein [Smithella sp.]